MTNKDKRQNNKNNQDGGVKPKSKKPSATERISKALKPTQRAIEKPTRAESAESMSIDALVPYVSPESAAQLQDVAMREIRSSMRAKQQPQRFVPGSVGPKKSRGPLTEEQKAARAATRAAKKTAVTVVAPVAPAVPTQEELDRARKEQAIAARAQEILAAQMEMDKKRPSRAAKSKVEEEGRQAAALAQAKKELAAEQKQEKKAMVSEVDELADLLGMMSTARPSTSAAAVAPVVLGMHSSGHPIVGYTPEGWPLGVNPVTGQVEPFSTPMGGKKKRTNKKKNQKGGEVEGAVVEDGKSQPAPVSGGKKKRNNKKNQKGGEVEGAVVEDGKSQPAPVSGGKKKRTNNKKN